MVDQGESDTENIKFNKKKGSKAGSKAGSVKSKKSQKLSDKVRMYEEMMTNTDNLESSLLTSIY